jgi:hypothetical protein
MNSHFAAILTSLAILPALVLAPPTTGAQRGKQTRTTPFGIDKRPMPSGTDLNTLVPVTVGAFRRDSLPPGAKPPSDEDLNVTYKSGADSVFFGFSIPEAVADAHEAIKVTREEAIASKVDIKGEQYAVGTDPSYFRAGSFMSWSRGRYFFYAKASSPAALESFLRAFPY